MLKKVLAATAALAIAAPAFAGPVLMTEEEMDRNVAGDVYIDIGPLDEIVIPALIEGFVDIYRDEKTGERIAEFCISGPRFVRGNACPGTN